MEIIIFIYMYMVASKLVCFALLLFPNYNYLYIYF